MSFFLVTGGAGFIGSHLCDALLARGDTVRVLDDLSTGYRENIDHLDVKFIEGSILDVDLVRDALADVDSVVHLAALGSVPRSIKDPMGTHAANATGNLARYRPVRAARSA